MATTFGQDFKASNKINARQAEVLDNLTDAETAEEVAEVRADAGARTWNALERRGMVTDAGITPYGTDVLYSHL